MKTDIDLTSPIVQSSQHPRAEHGDSAELVVAKSGTIKESETECC